jgi:hypothetical protein
MVRKFVGGALVGGAMTVGMMGAAAAQQAAAPVDPALAARITAEKDARKACKEQICKVFAERKGEGPISCDVTKTWLQDEIQKRILGDRLSWPWGHAQCKAKIELDRGDIAKLAASPEATVKLKKHAVACALDRKAPETGEAYAVKLSIAPEVSFKGGKASKVVVGWSDIEAPVLAKGPIWAATATDNTFNVLSSAMVGEINDFMFHHCADVGVKIAAPN